ncbi:MULTISPECIES: PH domain-containing protein [Pseudobutyrivibrio]|uniref:PH domain-containing protein n=1 Tax=Pseudobutyrivibrio ruminis TaxID=46206 RepID=A0A1H7JG15_9FIRM|nr:MULTISPECIES: PH domain-containing protein [Pseudobutyrivibrio]SEK73376.1 PH domain-containing protein [Pseudobutyrivibrio ruminis]SET10506.1 PH domain-containing protein [Pseudobutyrivibrio sp. C4]SFO66185.1 PH domain-containing protein [Pseudobutyrivibrio sp. JW11]
MANILWHDRKRHLGLPISFTKYSMSEDRLFVETGFFNLEQNEVRLYRILDLQLKRSLGQRIFGVGSIIVSSSDKSLGTFEIRNVKNSANVKEMLSVQVEQQREAKRVYTRENMVDDVDDNDIHEGDF